MTEQTDPFSALKEAAISVHEWFLSLTDAGFTEDQALSLIAQTIGSSWKYNGND